MFNYSKKEHIRISKENHSPLTPIKLSAIMLLMVRFFQIFGLFANSFQLYNQTAASNSSNRRLIIWIQWLFWIIAILFLITLINYEKFLYNNNDFGKYNDFLKLFATNIACAIAIAETLSRRREVQKFFRIYCRLHRSWANMKAKEEAQIYSHYILQAGFFVIAMFTTEFAYFHKVWAIYRTGDIQPFYQHLLTLPIVLISRLRLIQIMLYIELIRIEVQQFNRNIVQLKMSNILETDYLHLMSTYEQIHEMFITFERCTKLSLVATYTKSYVKMLSDWFWFFVMMHNGENIAGYALLIITQVNMILLMYISRNCMKATKLLGHNLHKLRHPVEDLKLSARIQNFSLQLRHQEIKITAFGLFVINFYVIKGILVSVATYMMFIIQFLPKI